MTRVREITVSRTVRVNTGNYEGTEHHVSITVELDELDTVKDILDKAAATVDYAMIIQLYGSYLVRDKNMPMKKISKHHGLTLEGKEKRL